MEGRTITNANLRQRPANRTVDWCSWRKEAVVKTFTWSFLLYHSNCTLLLRKKLKCNYSCSQTTDHCSHMGNLLNNRVITEHLGETKWVLRCKQQFVRSSGFGGISNSLMLLGAVLENGGYQLFSVSCFCTCISLLVLYVVCHWHLWYRYLLQFYNTDIRCPFDPVYSFARHVHRNEMPTWPSV